MGARHGFLKTAGTPLPETDHAPRHRLTRRCFAAWVAALPALAAARPAPGPTLARDAPPGVDPAGYLVSEKFDGVRALWMGKCCAFAAAAGGGAALVRGPSAEGTAGR